ncbi:MAG: DnaD domain protein [Ruminococcaceae bacterium]|nr:DnaD domain protein [Oscillospiraceae bacterium]
MKYEFNFGKAVICLPEATLSRLETAGATELKLLLLLAGRPDLCRQSDPETLGGLLGVSEAEAAIAISFWRGAGILTEDKKAQKKSKRVAPAQPSDNERDSEPEQMTMPAPAVVPAKQSQPSYTGQEMERILGANPGLQDTLNECQSILGKVFTQNDSAKFITLSDYYGLEDAYILLLCTYLCGIGKSSVAYVYKTATELYMNNVDSLEALESYIEKREKAASFEGRMRKLMGIGARALSTNEKKRFAEWSELDFTDDVLQVAYDETVDASGKASVNLMHTILTSWKEKGVQSVQDARSCIAERKQEMKKKYAKKGDAPGAGVHSFAETSFDTEEFFDIALKRSMEIAKEQQDGDKK